MKPLTSILLFLIVTLISCNITAQDTFSIVAVDTVTGEIGSAGASCVGAINGVGAYIISDVIEGIGGIHTQASWLAANQQNAHARMLEGLSPQEIIDWLVANDVQGNPAIRQYGIVDLTRNGESAGYTGNNCLNYKNHATGPGYSIQGNILLGSLIIDTMETTFLNTPGPLADKLMAALQAAKILGADTRCASRGTSSESGFIKVVRLGDGGAPYLQIIIPDTPAGTDPIDLVQEGFNDWKDSLYTFVDPFLSEIEAIPDTIPADGTSEAEINVTPKNNSDTLLAAGLHIILSNTGSGVLENVTDNGDGTYTAVITSPTETGSDTISAMVISSDDTLSLHQQIIITYITPVSIKQTRLAKKGYRLYQNYPQPFNPATTIRFHISEPGFVTLKVFDVLGNEIASLVNEDKAAGTYAVQFNGADLSSGVYTYQISAGSFRDTRKMILIK